MGSIVGSKNRDFMQLASDSANLANPCLSVCMCVFVSLFVSPTPQDKRDKRVQKSGRGGRGGLGHA